MQKTTKKIKDNFDFSYIKSNNLKQVADFEFMLDTSAFDEWFGYSYKIKDDDFEFLDDLIEDNIYSLKYYSEFQLSEQFINPLLEKVNFVSKDFGNWQSFVVSGIVNDYELSGKLDFLVAKKDEDKPEFPYFFIQEFEKSLANTEPVFQLLAKMSVAIEKNETNIMRGAYSVGSIWKFTILKKIDNQKYEYYESGGFNCMEIDQLKKIYINLQAIKFLYCK